MVSNSTIQRVFSSFCSGPVFQQNMVNYIYICMYRYAVCIQTYYANVYMHMSFIDEVLLHKTGQVQKGKGLH